eukprot:gene6639-61429_t
MCRVLCAPVRWLTERVVRDADDDAEKERKRLSMPVAIACMLICYEAFALHPRGPGTLD